MKSKFIKTEVKVNISQTHLQFKLIMNVGMEQVLFKLVLLLLNSFFAVILINKDAKDGFFLVTKESLKYHLKSFYHKQTKKKEKRNNNLDFLQNHKILNGGYRLLKIFQRIH